MNRILSCRFPQRTRFYETEIGRGLISDPEKIIPFLRPFGSKFVIISDSVVAGRYSDAFRKMLVEHGLNAYLFSFPEGESYKTGKTKEMLENQMLAARCGRDTCLIALGGGITTDLGGYIAATYCRGIPLVLIPTTLLGMADACIGGKTGVNTSFGKNMIGCIYQPVKIWMDRDTLFTLPIREIRNGIVEMIKHGLIADREYFTFLEEHAEPIAGGSRDVPTYAIFRSCEIKNRIVEEDEEENGIRHLLNFGHTFGHALEKETDYALSHGEAVAIGIIAESRIAEKSGLLSESSFDRIVRIFKRYDLSLKLPCKVTSEALLDAMILDKKSRCGIPRFVLLKDIGVPLRSENSYCNHVPENILKQTVDWIIHDLCSH